MKSCLDAAEELLRYVQEGIENGDTVADLLARAVADIGDGMNTSAPYTLASDNDAPALTPTQLVTLDRRGYVVHEDVVFHPGHWRPATDVEMTLGHTNEGKGVFVGHDGAIAAITRFADNWGRERHLW